MLKRNILLCFLVMFLLAFNSIAFAANPYASIMAYNAGNFGGGASKPNFSTLGVMDIINMTPWDISVGPAPMGTVMMSGMTSNPWASQWLAGFHKPGSSSNNFGGSFAFHSFQAALNNLNNAWALKNSLTGYTYPVYYDSIPIVFGTNSFTQSGKTVALTFSATSSLGYSVMYYLQAMNRPLQEFFPATTLSYGDGTNNYGWESNDTVSEYKTATHFLTIQALQGASWQPITKNLGGVVANAAGDGAPKGTIVQSPKLLNVAGLVYPNFSTVAGDNESLDFVVILQAGGYGDMQVLFLAVPNSNNSFR